jgi:hypothetical protein
MAVPAVKNAAYLGGEGSRNLAFTVAAAKPIPMPVGKPAAVISGLGPLGWNPSEYPWGLAVATYEQGGAPYVEDNITLGNIDGGWDAYLDLPAVTVPSPFGAPVKDCYGTYMYYSLNNGRFVIDYTDVWALNVNGTPDHGPSDCGRAR